MDRSEAHMASESPRIAGLDGVRGVAVLLVLVDHFAQDVVPNGPVSQAWVTLASFGWIGVDVFFVLSGFLITGILLDMKGQPGYFRTFYMRRVLRIFPLYYLTVAGVVIAGLVMSRAGLGASNLHQAVHAQGWLWSYLYNWKMAVTPGFHPGGYFVSHFWSLAVEEQFYLVWPSVVLALSGRQFRACCLGLVVLSLAVRVGCWLYGMDSAIPYVLTITRLDGLALGAWYAAMRWEGLSTTPYERPAMLSALAVLPAVFVLDPFTHGWPMMTIGLTALAIVGVALVQYVLDTPRSLFSSRLLVTFGTYSYGIYVLHIPLKRGLEYFALFTGATIQSVVHNPFVASIAMFLIGTTLSYGIARVSWWLVESRCLALKRYFPRPSTFHMEQEQRHAA